MVAYTSHLRNYYKIYILQCNSTRTLSAILQSAAQYFWFTIKGKRFDEYMEHDMDGWHLPFSPFW